LKTPVLVITARSAVDERISALDLGADDYLTKPFDYRELEARARALLRRSAGLSDNALRVGPHPAWHVEVGPSGVAVEWTGQESTDPLTVVRATANAIWTSGWTGTPPVVSAADDTARQALEQWSLLRGEIG
jgi:DNA-binding response OmpR family regulator